MRRYLLGLAAIPLTLIGLVGLPTPARADHHGWDHHHGWYPGHYGWDRDWHRWHGYGPYPSYYAAPYYNYTYPYYAPSYNYVYPNYGFGYAGPNVSFWVSP